MQKNQTSNFRILSPKYEINTKSDSKSDPLLKTYTRYHTIEYSLYTLLNMNGVVFGHDSYEYYTPKP